MTQTHQAPTVRRDENLAPRPALPKPAYRNLFLAADLPEHLDDEDDVALDQQQEFYGRKNSPASRR